MMKEIVIDVDKILFCVGFFVVGFIAGAIYASPKNTLHKKHLPSRYIDQQGFIKDH